MPLRIELGPKDMEKGVVMAARRDTGAKQPLPWADLAAAVPQLLETMQVFGGWVGSALMGKSEKYFCLVVYGARQRPK